MSCKTLSEPLVCIHTNTNPWQSSGWTSLFCPRVYSNSTIIPDLSTGVYPEHIGAKLLEDLIKGFQLNQSMVMYAWSFLDASSFSHGESFRGISGHHGILQLTPIFNREGSKKVLPIAGMLNSLTAIGGPDRQLFFELRARVVSPRIFVRSQSLIARLTRNDFSLPAVSRDFYKALLINDVSRGSKSYLFRAS